MTVLVDVGHSLREAAAMAVDTLWALVLGFTVSGAVQAFVSRDAMRRRLGDHRPATVARASLYGAASSSCSYAASAMARSLVARGADFVASMAFMVASTNLVVELGIVLVVLIGWQFVVAEVVGGCIMIALLAVAGSLWWRGRVLESARAAAGDGPGGGDDDAADRVPWRERVRTAGGWADAAGYTISDLRMLRKEVVVGFLAAGFVSELVPVRVWDDVFLHGHGTWTSLENVVVGPLVALLSFVCSVGNVPLAAALWKGGVTFGGVVSFVFGDLITLPLVLIYRRQYGGRMAARMLVVLWAVMSGAGLATEYLFRAVGLVPSTRPTAIAAGTWRIDPTTVADVVAVVVLAALVWLHRNRERLGGGAGYATDPVCGMQVERAHAPVSAVRGGERAWFCSEHCAGRWSSGSPVPADLSGGPAGGAGVGPRPPAVDPVCGMAVDPASPGAHRSVGGTDVWYCCEGCAEEDDRRRATSSA